MRLSYPDNQMPFRFGKALLGLLRISGMLLWFSISIHGSPAVFCLNCLPSGNP
jgi:hypothetical protein